jgi:hypothetical protein
VRNVPACKGSAGSGCSSSIRQVFHRPLDSSGPGSSSAVVISNYDAATGALLLRAKQRCTFTRTPVKVRPETAVDSPSF